MHTLFQLRVSSLTLWAVPYLHATPPGKFNLPCSRALWQSVLNAWFFFPHWSGNFIQRFDPDSDSAAAIEAFAATDHNQMRAVGVQWNEGDAALKMKESSMVLYQQRDRAEDGWRQWNKEWDNLMKTLSSHHLCPFTDTSLTRCAWPSCFVLHHEWKETEVKSSCTTYRKSSAEVNKHIKSY